MYHVADARAPRPEYRGSWDTHVSRLVGFRSFKRRACALKGYLTYVSRLRTGILPVLLLVPVQYTVQYRTG